MVKIRSLRGLDRKIFNVEIRTLGDGCNYYLLQIPADLFHLIPEVAGRFHINGKRKFVSPNRMMFLEI